MKPCLTADDARRILRAARVEAERHQWNVSIAVVDDGGELLVLERGVSGVASRDDEQIARAGVEALAGEAPAS